MRQRRREKLQLERGRGMSCSRRGGRWRRSEEEAAARGNRRETSRVETRICTIGSILSLFPLLVTVRAWANISRACVPAWASFSRWNLFPLPDKPERLIWAKACKGGLRRTIQTPYKLRRVRRLAIWGRPDAKASPKRRLRDALKTMVGINRRIR